MKWVFRALGVVLAWSVFGIIVGTVFAQTVGDLPEGTNVQMFTDGSGGQAFVHLTEPDGTVLSFTVTFDRNYNLVTPDGGNALSTLSEGGTYTSPSETRGSFSTTHTTGVVYGTYGNGDPMISGFYQAPNNNYYPIQVACGTKCKSDGTLRGFKGSSGGIQYNCPDETYVRWNVGDYVSVCANCQAGNTTCPGGNRARWTGRACGNPRESITEVSMVCVPKCPVGTTYTKTYVQGSCVKAKFCTGSNSYLGAVCGWAGGENKNWCYTWYGAYTCPPNSLTGKVFYDESNTCSSARPWDQGYGPVVSAAPLNGRAALYGLVVSGGADAGQFKINTANTLYNVTLTGIPPGYSCSTAPGCNSCPTRTGEAGYSVGNNFYLTKNVEPWWQAEGAPVYAGSLEGGVTVRSELKAGNNLIMPGPGGAVGALIRASGTVDVGGGVVSTPGYSTIARYRGKVMNYDFFAPYMSVLSSQESDWASTNLDNPPTELGKDFYYSRGDSTVTTPWAVAAGQSYVIFVNGDLRIGADISVEHGGFLAFIVNGEITVDPTVQAVQGLYVADHEWVTESVFVEDVTFDVPLQVEGSVVAWGGVDLRRNIGGDTNVTTPAEKFTYRPDLIVNMPNRMKTFALRWQEVPPGTFGE